MPKIRKQIGHISGKEMVEMPLVNVWGKRFKLPQLTHESFLAIDDSCKIFF